ncbi:MAG: hypothetical protein P8170_11010 [Gemmatimonadota bacterium]
MCGHEELEPTVSDELGRDMELASALERLVDPATRDANYWLRFRAWVLGNAAPELARRRQVVNLTVGDVLTAWSRALVPTAIAASLAAALLLFQGQPAPAEVAIGIEELLTEGLEEEIFPAALESPDAEAVTFAMERF